MKLHIKTYGCQMNVYDSSRMAAALAPLGYDLSDAPENADMVLINSCHIREKAAQKIYSEVGRLRSQQKDKAIIAVAGCVAQAEGEEMLRRAPEIDIVVGPQSYHLLPELVMRVLRKQGRQMDISFPEVSKFDVLPAHKNKSVSAFITIQEGCDKFCTFCVVPYTRGAEYSRAVRDIVQEARRLIDEGAKELVLLGQNVNAYHGMDEDGQECDLASLLTRLDGLEGVKRLRYTTSHPCDMSETLIKAHGELDSLMPFVHLPLQSGSDKILRAMNRKHSLDEYKDIIRKLRHHCPEVALSSDFICGFPSETDEDHEMTLRAIEEIGFAQGYAFCYSPRPGTPAALREDDKISDEIASRRLQEILQLVGAQQKESLHLLCGRTVPVLFEKKGRHQGQLVGRTAWMQAVACQAQDEDIGRERNVRIEAVASHSLTGTIES